MASSVFAALVFVLLISIQSIDARRSHWKWNSPKPAPVPPTVFGTVFCDQCLEKTFSFNTIAIANVTATVECGSFQASNTTNELGVFTIQIPADVKSGTCTVKVADDFSRVQGDLSACTKPLQIQFGFPAPSPPPSSLKAFQEGWPFYAAGPFFFQPAEALPACKSNPFVVPPHKNKATTPPPHPKLDLSAAPPHGAFPGFEFPITPAAAPPHPKPDFAAAAPPHESFPGFGFPPSFPGTYPPHPQPVGAQPPHSRFSFPPFFPGAFPPHPKPESPNANSPPPPSFGSFPSPPSFGSFPSPPSFGSFPSHPKPAPSHFPRAFPPQPKPAVPAPPHPGYKFPPFFPGAAVPPHPSYTPFAHPPPSNNGAPPPFNFEE